MAKVSVIVPNYNHAQFLEQRLDSLFGQTYSDLELVLLDDASTDGSKDILLTHVDHPLVSQVLINETNSGSPFKQWKKGIAQATGEYIWIAESDDFCSSKFLERCVQVLEDDPTIGLVYTQSVDVNNEGVELEHRVHYTAQFEPNIWKGDFVLDGDDFIKKYLSHKNVIPNASAVVFRKSLLKESMPFEDIMDMRMCGDWFFWLRLIPTSRIAFISSVHNFFRQHPDMSRMQKSPERKKQRISEEHRVRIHLYKNAGLKQSEYFDNLKEKWFRLSDKWSIFKKDFYKVRDPKLSRPIFGIQFLMHKLKKRSN